MIGTRSNIVSDIDFDRGITNLGVDPLNSEVENIKRSYRLKRDPRKINLGMFNESIKIAIDLYKVVGVNAIEDQDSVVDASLRERSKYIENRPNTGYGDRHGRDNRYGRDG